MNRNIIEIIIQFAAVLFAISVHESAHAWMAYRFGDSTAKNQGRITLNPIAHIDLFGTIIFPLILVLIGAPPFGWAKPVMVNPFYLRNPRKAGVFISAAGPGSNIIVAGLCVGIFRLLKNFAPGLILHETGFNAGGLILLSLIIINIYLAIFNLIPIPPLDGSGILEGLLSGGALRIYLSIKPYGFIILLGIVYFGLLDFIARPIFSLVHYILV